MIEALQGIFSAARERVRAVFVGTYLLAWMIINYRPLLILIFSDRAIEDRYTLMDQYWPNLWIQWLLPLGVCAAILFIGIVADYAVFTFRSSYLCKMQIARLDHLTLMASKRRGIAEHNAASERATQKQREDFELKKLQLEKEASKSNAFSEVSNMQHENSMLRAQLEDAKKQADRINKQYDDARRDHDDLIRRTAVAEASSNASQTQARDYHDENRSLKEKVATLESDQSRMARELDDARATITRQSKTISLQEEKSRGE